MWTGFITWIPCTPTVARTLWCLSCVQYHCQLQFWFPKSSNCFGISISPDNVSTGRGSLRGGLGKSLSLFLVSELKCLLSWDPVLPSRRQVQGLNLAQMIARDCDILWGLLLSLLIMSLIPFDCFLPSLLTLQIPCCIHHHQHSFWSGPGGCHSNRVIIWMFVFSNMTLMKP